MASPTKGRQITLDEVCGEEPGKVAEPEVVSEPPKKRKAEAVDGSSKAKVAKAAPRTEGEKHESRTCPHCRVILSSASYMSRHKHRL